MHGKWFCAAHKSSSLSSGQQRLRLYPAFLIILLTNRGAHRVTANSFLPEDAGLHSSLCLGTLLESRKHSGPGFLHSSPPEADMHHSVQAASINARSLCTDPSRSSHLQHTDHTYLVLLPCHFLLYSKVPKNPALTLIHIE